MQLHFETAAAHNSGALFSLRPADGQAGFVESVAQCLAEAAELDWWRPVGIYDGDTAVGFAMYGLFIDEEPGGRVWLDRLLIDARFQGRGYGSAALSGLLACIRDEYHPPRVYLSVVKGNSAATALYRKFGFRFNGEKDIHGEDVMVLSLARPQ